MASIATAFASDRASCARSPARRAPKEFDHVRAPRRPRLEVRRAEPSDIPQLLRSAEAEIGMALAPERTVAAVAAAHPDALWAFRRAGRVVGGFAMLMLDKAGLRELLADRIDCDNPLRLCSPVRAKHRRPSTSGRFSDARWRRKALRPSSSGSKRHPTRRPMSSRSQPLRTACG